MAKIDDLVLTLKFDNSKFKSAAQETLATLDRLKSSMKIGGFKNAFKSSTKDAIALGNAVNNVDLSKMEKQVSGIKNQFSLLGTVGRTAIGKLTVDAMNMGKKLVNVITGPLVQGGMNRAKNIEQARFQLKGLGADVEAIEKAAMNAVDGTAYGFDQAARAASQFYASGVKDAGAMEEALLGISGAAAMTGASYDDIAAIFTTVSGNGKLMTDQLNQFATRGLNVAATLGEQLGMTEGEFRDAVSNGKIAFEDFYKGMTAAYGEHAKKAGDTFAGAMANAKAPLSRIGADVAAVYLEQMKGLFNAIRPFLNVVHGALKPVIELINDMQTKGIGRLTNFINSLSEGLSKGGNTGWLGDIGQGIANIMVQVDALRDSFWRAFGRQWIEVSEPVRAVLDRLAKGFLTLTEHVKFSSLFLYNNARIFGAVFAVIDTGIIVVKSLAKSLLTVGGAIAGEIIPHLLTFVRYIARTISWILRWIKGAELIEKAFDGVTKVLVGIIKVIGKVIYSITKVTDAIIGFFHGILQTTLKGTPFDPSIYPERQAKSFLKMIKGIGSSLKSIPTKGLETVAKVFAFLGTVTKEVFETVKAFVKSIDFSGVAKMFDWVKNLSIFNKIKNPFEKFSNWDLDLSGATKSVQSFGDRLRSSIGPRAGIGEKLFEPIKTGFSNSIEFLQNVNWSNVFDSILSGITSGAKAVADAFKKMFDNVKDFVGQVDWANVGSTIVEKLAEGLSKTAEITSKIAKALKETIENAVKDIDLGKIWDNIKNFGKNVGDAVEEGVSGAKDAIDDLSNTEATVTVKTQGLDTETISKSSKSTIDKIKDIGAELKEAFTGIGKPDLAAIQSTFGATFAAIIQGISGGFKNITGIIKEAYSWISNPIATGTKKLTKGFTSSFKTFTDTAVKTVAGSIDSIGDAASKIDLGKVASVFAQLANAASFFMMAQAIKGLADSFSAIPTSIAGFFDGLTASVKGFAEAAKTEAKGNYILKMAGAIAILAASLWLLSSIPTGDLLKGGAAIALLMGSLFLFAKYMDKVKIDKDLPLMILAIAGSMAIMAFAIKQFASMEWETFGSGILKLAGALGVLVLAMKFMPDKAMVKASFGILMLTGALWSMFFAIKMFSMLDPDTAADGLMRIFSSLLILTGAMWVLNRADPLKAAASLAILAGSLAVFLYIIQTFSSMDPDEFISGIGKVIVAIGVLVLALIAVDKWAGSAIRASISIGILAGSLMLLAFALRIMSGMSLGDMLGPLLGVAVGIAVLVRALNKMTKPGELEKVAATLIGLAGAMLLLSVSIFLLGQMDTGALVQGLLAVVGTLLAVGAAAALISKVGGPGLGVQLAMIGVGIALLAASVMLLGNMDVESLKQGLIGLAVGLGLLLLAALGAQFVAAGLAILAGVFLALAAAVLIVGAGLLIGGIGFAIFAASLQMVLDKGPQLQEFAAGIGALAGPMALLAGSLTLVGLGLLVFALGLAGLAVVSTIGGLGLAIFVKLMGKFADAIMTLSEALALFDSSGASGLQKMAELGNNMDGFGAFIGKMKELKDVVNKKFANSFEKFASSMAKFKDAASGLSEAFAKIGEIDMSSISNMQEQLGQAFSKDLGNEFKKAAKSVSSGINQIVDAIRNSDGKFEQAGVHLGGKLAGGLKKSDGRIKNAGTNAAKSGAAGAKSARGEFVSAGKYIGDGLAEGIRQATASAAQAAAAMAREASAAARANLKVKSPSRVFMEIGNFVGLGFAAGIASATPKSTKASAKMAGGVISAATSTLEIHSPSKVFKRIGGNVNEGFAEGIDRKADRPADAMGRTADGVIGAVESRTGKMQNAADTFFEAFFGKFEDAGLTRRLERLVGHAKALHATSIKEQKIKQAEDREKKEDEHEQVYRDVEDAKRELADARKEAAEAKDEANGVNKDAQSEKNKAKKTKSDAKKIDRDNTDAAKKNEESKRKYEDSQRKVRDAEKKYRRSISKKERYEYQQYGSEAGVAFVDGVAEGLIDESDKLPSLHEVLTEVLYEELDKVKKEANDFVGIFEGVQTIGKNFRDLGDKANELRRAFARMSHSTNPRTFMRNMGATFDAILEVGKGLVGFMDVAEKFKPYLPLLFKLFDDNLGSIIPLVAQFSPYLASVLGGGLEAALPMIAGPAAAIVAAVAGIGYLIYDSGGEQRVLTFIRTIVESIVEFAKNLPELITNFIKQAIDGIVNLITEIPKLAKTLIVGLIEALTNLIRALPEKLPEIIIALVDGLVTLITETPELIVDLAFAIIDALIEMFFVAIPELIVKLPGMFVKIGVAIVQGIIKGMTSIPRAIGNAVVGVAQRIKNGFKRFFGIRSPSRLMAEMGGYITEGLAVGMEEGQPYADAAVKNVAQSVVDTAKDILSEDLGDGLDFTITPVLDMSDVDEEWARFDRSQTLNAAQTYGNASNVGSVRRSAEDDVIPNNSTVINYTQNNTSPNPLSTIDIYRNTQRQLEDMK